MRIAWIGLFWFMLIVAVMDILSALLAAPIPRSTWFWRIGDSIWDAAMIGAVLGWWKVV